MSEDGGAVGWGGDPGGTRGRVTDPLKQPPLSPRHPDDFTIEDIVRAVGKEVRVIRTATIVIAVVAVVQAVFIILWLLGVITIEFKPISSGF